MKTRITFITIAFAISFSAVAQVINPKETAKRKVEERTNRATDRTIDKGLDKLEKGIGSIFKKKNKDKKEDNPTTSSSNANTDNGKTSGVNSGGTGSAKSNSNFDFVPGNKVIYSDNFERLNIGDFPAEFNTTASGEVVTVSGKDGKWLAMTKNGAFIPEKIKELPTNFTLEFEVGISGDVSNNYSGFGINFTTNYDDLLKDVVFFEGSLLHLHPGDDMLSVQIIPKTGTEINNQIPMPQWSIKGKPFTKISIWRQDGRLRLYVNESKLVDMPRFFIENKPYKMAFFRRFLEDCNVFMTNIRYAIAGEDTRTKLLNEGKFVTNEILFDVNSDKIKAESNKIITEIGNLLTENPTVKLKIVGHTDSDGDVAANLALSKKRAQSVKTRLAYGFGIDESRLLTDGKGEGEPVTSNNTPQGKAQNRRVEFIKL